jgi:hypothetical protein
MGIFPEARKPNPISRGPRAFHPPWEGPMGRGWEGGRKGSRICAPVAFVATFKSRRVNPFRLERAQSALGLCQSPIRMTGIGWPVLNRERVLDPQLSARLFDALWHGVSYRAAVAAAKALPVEEPPPTKPKVYGRRVRIVGAHDCKCGFRVVFEPCLICDALAARAGDGPLRDDPGTGLLGIDLRVAERRRWRAVQARKRRQGEPGPRPRPGRTRRIRMCQSEWTLHDARQLGQLVAAIAARKPSSIATALWFLGGSIRFAAAEP